MQCGKRHIDGRFSNSWRFKTGGAGAGCCAAVREPLAPGYFIIFCLFLILLCGCAAGGDGRDKDVVKPKPVVSTVERGPVRLTAELKSSPARLSDQLTLTLKIDAAEGVKAPMPPFAETLSDFQIRDIKDPLPRIRDGREITRRILVLDPTRAGRITIDPINIAFTDTRPDGDSEVHEMETEPIRVEITSKLDGAQPSLDGLRAAADPLDMPAPTPFWVWALAGLAAVGLIVGGVLYSRQRREKAVAAIILTPEEIANRELDELVASRLAERDVVLFYVEMTGIVRRYIEQTTGIRAPEQTTEEFLREMSREDSLALWERVRERALSDGCRPPPPTPLSNGEESIKNYLDRLRMFLEAADLVKFAALRPRAEDIDESVNRARLFIGMRRLQQLMAAKAGEVVA